MRSFGNDQHGMGRLPSRLLLHTPEDDDEAEDDGKGLVGVGVPPPGGLFTVDGEVQGCTYACKYTAGFASLPATRPASASPEVQEAAHMACTQINVDRDLIVASLL